MPEITGVRERRGRARVFVDGEFWAEIDPGVAAERGLREGVVLGLEELDEVRRRILGEVYEKLGLDQSSNVQEEEEETPEQRPVEPAEQII